jgi:hypothetical protein
MAFLVRFAEPKVLHWVLTKTPEETHVVEDTHNGNCRRSRIGGDTDYILGPEPQICFSAIKRK